MFHTWLADAMADAGITQADLVRGTGRTSSTVARWVGGKIVPDPDNCELIARALGRPVTEVWREAGYDVSDHEPLIAAPIDDFAAIRQHLDRLERQSRRRTLTGHAATATTVELTERQSRHTMESIGSVERGAWVSVASVTGMLAAVERWSAMMPEVDVLVVTIASEWLAPTYGAGTVLVLARPEEVADRRRWPSPGGSRPWSS